MDLSQLKQAIEASKDGDGFRRSVSPQTILKLIAIAEAAKEVEQRDGGEHQYFALHRLYAALEGIE